MSTDKPASKMTKAELIAHVALLEKKLEDAGTKHRTEVQELKRQINELVDTSNANATTATEDRTDLIQLMRVAKPIADAIKDWNFPDDGIALSRKLTFGMLRQFGLVSRSISPRR